MEDLVLILNTSEIPVCQTPVVLQVIYFAKLIFNIIHILLPIALIIYMMVDFSKCLIMNDESKQSVIVKLSLKRVFYAVLVYAVPYIISVFASILSNLIPDYNLCITNATSENIEVFTAQYEAAERKEEEERKEAWMNNVSNNISSNVPSNNISNSTFLPSNSDYVYKNLGQCSDSWGSYPVCKVGSTMCSSGCGYVAYAMIVRYHGYSDVTPDQISDIACDEYGYTGGAASRDFLTSKLLNDKFNMVGAILADDSSLNKSEIGIDHGKKYLSDVKAALKAGKSLIVQIPGHYLSILAINGDETIIVGDSGGTYASTNKYTVDSLYDATKDHRGRCVSGRNSCGWNIIMSFSKK